MAEKKRQYSRALAQKRCLEAIERAILINKSEAERPFVFQVQELVVFGPLVDTDAPTVHGVDILATTARHHRYQNRDEAFHSDSEDFINKYAPFSICSWRFREEFPEKDMLNYLKGRHMGIVTMYGQQNRALLDDGGEYTKWGIRLPFRSERVWQSAGMLAANRARFPTYTELCYGSELGSVDSPNLAAHDMPLEEAVYESESRAAHLTCKRRAGNGRGCQRMPEHF